MNRKGFEFTMGTVVAILIGLLVLIIILGYIFFASGGPKQLMDSLLGFMGNQTDYVVATTSNI